MPSLTQKLAKQLKDAIYFPDFADLFVMEKEVVRIEQEHDLDDPAVIAALATCADLQPVQKRLVERPAPALAKGLALAASTKLRDTAALLVGALLDAAQREAAAPTEPTGAKTKAKAPKTPAFARAARLPALLGRDGVPADGADLVQALLGGKEIAAESYDAASLATFGRALVLGWLAHGADSKARSVAMGAAPFLDDATARDLASYAKQIASRVGQFSKAQSLIDVIAAIPRIGALSALHDLALQVQARSVENRAREALAAAAKRLGLTEHELADRILSAKAGAVRDIDRNAFIQRLEQRMLTGASIPMRELVESVVQVPEACALARNVVFEARGPKRALFTIDKDDELVDVNGAKVITESSSQIVVVHPLDLSTSELETWRRRCKRQPFAQLARKLPDLPDAASLIRHTRALEYHETSAHKLAALEELGWQRASLRGGKCTALSRTEGGITVVVSFLPGLSTRSPANQRIEGVAIKGEGAQRVLGTFARQLGLLA